MKRSTFLRSLAAVPAAFMAVATKPTTTIAALTAYDSRPTTSINSPPLSDVMYRSLRYRPITTLHKLAKTGSMEKWSITALGKSGVIVRKTVIIHEGDAYTNFGYQTVKRAKEAARDIAYHEDIDWRRNEHEWMWNR